MKIGPYTINQRSNGDYDLLFADKSNEYNSIKVLIKQTDLIQSIDKLIDDNLQLRMNCATLFQIAMHHDINSENEIPEEVIKVLEYVVDDPDPIPIGIRIPKQKERLIYHLTMWIEGFNLCHNTNFLLEDVFVHLNKSIIY